MYQNILIPLDGSDCSEKAAQQGLELAARLGGSVTFLYVVEDPLYYARNAVSTYGTIYEDLREIGREVLDSARKRAELAGVAAETVLVDTPMAHPVDAILEAEAEHDLTVMGTHGRRGFNRLLLGSVAEGVLRRSRKPQLVIRCDSNE